MRSGRARRACEPRVLADELGDVRRPLPRERRSRATEVRVHGGRTEDGAIKLEYIKYELGKPRYSPDECRQLRLTYGRPFRVWLRLVKDEPIEEEVYLGDMPIMLGGGEFIINGAERVVVSQLHRSPGIAFEVTPHANGKPLHSFRIIPDRGTWLEVQFDNNDLLYVYLDRRRRRRKFLITTLLRAIGYSSDIDLLNLFYEIKDLKVSKALDRLTGQVVALKQVRLRLYSLESHKAPGDTLLPSTDSTHPPRQSAGLEAVKTRPFRQLENTATTQAEQRLAQGDKQ
mgnify:CR=1 FL=1